MKLLLHCRLLLLLLHLLLLLLLVVVVEEAVVVGQVEGMQGQELVVHQHQHQQHQHQQSHHLQQHVNPRMLRVLSRPRPGIRWKFPL